MWSLLCCWRNCLLLLPYRVDLADLRCCVHLLPPLLHRPRSAALRALQLYSFAALTYDYHTLIIKKKHWTVRTIDCCSYCLCYNTVQALLRTKRKARHLPVINTCRRCDTSLNTLGTMAQHIIDTLLLSREYPKLVVVDQSLTPLHRGSCFLDLKRFIPRNCAQLKAKM